MKTVTSHLLLLAVFCFLAVSATPIDDSANPSNYEIVIKLASDDGLPFGKGSILLNAVCNKKLFEVTFESSTDAFDSSKELSQQVNWEGCEDLNQVKYVTATFMPESSGSVNVEHIDLISKQDPASKKRFVTETSTNWLYSGGNQVVFSKVAQIPSPNGGSGNSGSSSSFNGYHLELRMSLISDRVPSGTLQIQFLAKFSPDKHQVVGTKMVLIEKDAFQLDEKVTLMKNYDGQKIKMLNILWMPDSDENYVLKSDLLFIRVFKNGVKQDSLSESFSTSGYYLYPGKTTQIKSQFFNY